MKQWADLQKYYDYRSADYAREHANELRNKPLDRELLIRFSRMVNSDAPVCEVGCGPGQISRYLFETGVRDIFGVDISPEMISQAKALHPEIRFQAGDMMALETKDNGLSGLVAFYAIIHLKQHRVRDALAEFYRVLAPGGVLLLAFHIGGKVITSEMGDGDTRVSADFILLDNRKIENDLETLGFELQESLVRRPYKDVEYQSRRAYVLARKPSTIPAITRKTDET